MTVIVRSNLYSYHAFIFKAKLRTHYYYSYRQQKQSAHTFIIMGLKQHVLHELFLPVEPRLHNTLIYVLKFTLSLKADRLDECGFVTRVLYNQWIFMSCDILTTPTTPTLVLLLLVLVLLDKLNDLQ